MENITILPKSGRLSSKMRRHLERSNLITSHRLKEHIRQSEIKALENIIDEAFGVETEPRKVLTLKRRPQNDGANVIANLIVQVKGDEQEPTPSFDNCCMSDVALYSTKTKPRRRLESGGVTARG
ncbi:MULTISPECIES: hypothetical protein [Xenorhabdus]|uniref:transcriptional antitermination N peptide n=1 Tax=Xenorhabdus TaxID=626 RepID=UPI00064986BD|nr:MULTISPECIES: hypothetical protein [Xenorhabdus]KLU15019.1 hypothetical protein AAY47_13165 [Xenorhabdus griffiniae]KOP35161.1 hypothetical protein AFK69_00615 [Xenorhabdus sp. GDc328]